MHSRWFIKLTSLPFLQLYFILFSPDQPCDNPKNHFLEAKENAAKQYCAYNAEPQDVRFYNAILEKQKRQPDINRQTCRRNKKEHPEIFFLFEKRAHSDDYEQHYRTDEQNPICTVMQHGNQRNQSGQITDGNLKKIRLFY